MKTEELEKIGLNKDQVTEVMKINGKDIEDLKKENKNLTGENQALTTERDTYKTQYETAKKTLDGLDGKSPEDIVKERDTWKKKAEDLEQDYNNKLAEREKQDLLKEAFADIKFTSESAKKAIMAQISEGVTVKNGKLIGFNDLLEDAKKNDASAFVDEKQQHLENNKAKFTTQQKSNTGEGLTKDQIMAMKDPSERQKAIKEHIELFQKGE